MTRFQGCLQRLPCLGRGTFVNFEACLVGADIQGVHFCENFCPNPWGMVVLEIASKVNQLVLLTCAFCREEEMREELAARGLPSDEMEPQARQLLYNSFLEDKDGPQLLVTPP